MTHAILLGSIGTLAETSDLQRQAFNAAFAEAGLDWRWSPGEYAQMLRHAGGTDRIAAHAEARGETVDVAALHARKSALFQQALATADLAARPGVLDTLTSARDAGWRVGLVTTTAPGNVDAVLGALDLRRPDFDLVLDRTHVARAKPAPDAYHRAVADLGLSPAKIIAVEDNPDGSAAARAAGLECLAFPGQAHAASSFPKGMPILQVLHLNLRLAA